MAIFDGNLVMSFTAQYKAEDTAAYLLYEIDRKTLSEKAVSSETLCSFFGVDVRNENYGNDGELCFVAYDPQLLYCSSGDKIILDKPGIVIEKSAVENDFKLHNYAVALGLSYYLIKKANTLGKKAEQMSFGLGETPSLSNRRVTLSDMEIYAQSGVKFSEADNFAMCLTMPKNRFKNMANSVMAERKINRSGLSGNHLDYAVCKLSDGFNVPETVVKSRFKRLGYI